MALRGIVTSDSRMDRYWYLFARACVLSMMLNILMCRGGSFADIEALEKEVREFDKEACEFFGLEPTGLRSLESMEKGLPREAIEKIWEFSCS